MAPAIAAIIKSENMKYQAPPDDPVAVEVKASGCTSNISVSPISEKRPYKKYK